MLSPYSCNKKCITKITEERRKEIHRQFWDEDYAARGAWIFTHVKAHEPTRPNRFWMVDNTRKNTRVYVLPDNDGKETFVCKTFFLRTLGYKSDKIITVNLTTVAPGSITTKKT